jgi:hypothetical protein
MCIGRLSLEREGTEPTTELFERVAPDGEVVEFLTLPANELLDSKD